MIIQYTSVSKHIFHGGPLDVKDLNEVIIKRLVYSWAFMAEASTAASSLKELNGGVTIVGR